MTSVAPGTHKNHAADFVTWCWGIAGGINVAIILWIIGEKLGSAKAMRLVALTLVLVVLIAAFAVHRWDRQHQKSLETA